jgi:cation transport ATPase
VTAVAPRRGPHGLDRVYADCTPQDKLQVVRSVRARADLRPVTMVGDGVDDAPALAMADVGIATGGPGATASSEAADAVITSSAIGAVATAVAAAGLLPPVAGALLQEGIDVAVILNVLPARTG